MSVLKVTKCKFTQNRPYEAIFCKSLLIFDTDLVLHRIRNYHTLLFRFSTSPHLRVNIRSVTVTRRRPRRKEKHRTGSRNYSEARRGSRSHRQLSTYVARRRVLVSCSLAHSQQHHHDHVLSVSLWDARNERRRERDSASASALGCNAHGC